MPLRSLDRQIRRPSQCRKCKQCANKCKLSNTTVKKNQDAIIVYSIFFAFVVNGAKVINFVFISLFLRNLLFLIVYIQFWYNFQKTFLFRNGSILPIAIFLCRFTQKNAQKISTDILNFCELLKKEWGLSFKKCRALSGYYLYLCNAKIYGDLKYIFNISFANTFKICIQKGNKSSFYFVP